MGGTVVSGKTEKPVGRLKRAFCFMLVVKSSIFIINAISPIEHYQQVPFDITLSGHFTVTRCPITAELCTVDLQHIKKPLRDNRRKKTP